MRIGKRGANGGDYIGVALLSDKRLRIYECTADCCRSVGLIVRGEGSGNVGLRLHGRQSATRLRCKLEGRLGDFPRRCVPGDFNGETSGCPVQQSDACYHRREQWDSDIKGAVIRRYGLPVDLYIVEA